MLDCLQKILDTSFHISNRLVIHSLSAAFKSESVLAIPFGFPKSFEIAKKIKRKKEKQKWKQSFWDDFCPFEDLLDEWLLNVFSRKVLNLSTHPWLDVKAWVWLQTEV